MAANEKMIAAYENALLGILQNEGGLEPFLDVIFGFLCRRTDFFLTMKSETQKFGFPPGVAEKMVLTYFKKYHNIVQQAELQKNKEKKLSPKAEDVKKEVVGDNDASNKSDSRKNVEKPVNTSTNDSSNNENTSSSISNDKSKESPNPQIVESASESKDKQEIFQSNPDSYNGAIRDNYCWSQNYDDVDVKITVPQSVARAKQVMVDIQRKHLKVMVKKNETSACEFYSLIDDDLQHEVNREESMWSLESGKHISITLTKDKNIWWSMLLLSEEEIDIQKIAPERSMADMDEEEKAVINKLQFDDRQKKLGLPQSHELQVHEMLKKGWDAEGSPFKGQDFDPKMFNISPGAVDK